jgi:DHA1 family multidrug resistance protein-like MFS transporter
MNWKICLAILTCNVVFMSASYTMLVPFLPLYLTHELGCDPASVNLWSGLVFSFLFCHYSRNDAYLGRTG